MLNRDRKTWRHYKAVSCKSVAICFNKRVINYTYSRHTQITISRLYFSVNWIIGENIWAQRLSYLNKLNLLETISTTFYPCLVLKHSQYYPRRNQKDHFKSDSYFPNNSSSHINILNIKHFLTDFHKMYLKHILSWWVLNETLLKIYSGSPDGLKFPNNVALNSEFFKKSQNLILSDSVNIIPKSSWWLQITDHNNFSNSNKLNFTENHSAKVTFLHVITWKVKKHSATNFKLVFS